MGLVSTLEKSSNLLDQALKVRLKVEPCKLYNNKHMITGIFAVLAVLVFKLTCKFLFVNTKDNRNC